MEKQIRSYQDQHSRNVNAIQKCRSIACNISTPQFRRLSLDIADKTERLIRKLESDHSILDHVKWVSNYHSHLMYFQGFIHGRFGAFDFANEPDEEKMRQIHMELFLIRTETYPTSGK